MWTGNGQQSTLVDVSRRGGRLPAWHSTPSSARRRSTCQAARPLRLIVLRALTAFPGRARTIFFCTRRGSRRCSVAYRHLTTYHDHAAGAPNGFAAGMPVADDRRGLRAVDRAKCRPARRAFRRRRRRARAPQDAIEQTACVLKSMSNLEDSSSKQRTSPCCILAWVP